MTAPAVPSCSVPLAHFLISSCELYPRPMGLNGWEWTDPASCCSMPCIWNSHTEGFRGDNCTFLDRDGCSWVLLRCAPKRKSGGQRDDDGRQARAPS